LFTGLVEEVGVVERLEEAGGGRRLWIAASRVLADAREGDSLAVNGCCLTAARLDRGCFVADVVPETLARTTVGGWRAGERVNLERSMRLDDRLGGHLVQGHVDGVADVVSVEVEGNGRRVGLRIPAALLRFVAEKGSIAVDGVSLTVASRREDGCDVALVPHTLEATVASDWGAGHRVNVEVDMIARYVARLMEAVPGGAR
jgi:riboflavin synthase